MNRALLPKEDYYRPRRAEELRRKADRLDRRVWQRLGAGVASTLVLLGLVLCWADRKGTGEFTVWELVLLAVLLLAVLGWWVFLNPLLMTCPGRYREEAAALEAEHQARHGALPPGEES